MSKLFVCIGKKADMPYCIQDGNVTVYTLEELCYYICDRAQILDENLRNEKLVMFIKEQLGLEELSDTLARILQWSRPLHEFCRAVLEYADYPDPQIREQVLQTIEEGEYLPVLRRLQRQGDKYMQQKQYYQAQKVYRNMLQREDVQKDTILLAEIYAKLGDLAARMFQYEAAAYCFEKSCRFDEKRQIRKKYLLCQRFLMTKEQYLTWIASKEEYYELSVDAQREYENAKSFAQQQLMEQMQPTQTEQLKEEFRHMVME